jgi:hypothetical protein
MDGFRTFQYHIALKIHFTKQKFSVFENKGFLRGSYETYLKRNDYFLYEKLSNKYDTPQEIIQFLASNIMYNNQSIVYNLEDSEVNYNEYLRRKQSITKVFTDDMYTILNRHIPLTDYASLFNLFLGNKITIETFRILDDLTGNIIESLKQNQNIISLFDDVLLRAEKAKGFVLYKKEKVQPIYLSYLQEEL